MRRKRRPAEQTTHFEGLPVDVEVTGIALRDIAFHSGSLDLELQKADLAVSASDKTIRIAETALSGACGDAACAAKSAGGHRLGST